MSEISPAAAVLLGPRPFLCTICNTPFGPNPRLEKWLNGNTKLPDLPMVHMCWVCAHLASSIRREAREIALYWQEGQEEAA